MVTSAKDSEIWAGVDRLVDRAPSLGDLRRHRLHLFAARRWRALGRPVPEELLEEERKAALVALSAPALLERVRAGYDGPVVLFKGPEVAARYPDPALRDFIDIDLLVPDAEAAQRALIASGFVEFGDPELYVDLHHLRPLYWPGLLIRVEMHGAPKWIDELQAPAPEEFISATVPSAVGVEGIQALAPAEHALALAVHAWAHEPLGRLFQLVDVAAVAQEADRAEIGRLARKWGIEGVWDTTIRAAETLLLDSSKLSWALRLWARHLPASRERNVLEAHMERWLSGFWGLPLSKAVRRSASEIAWEVRPTPGETWRNKLSRSRRAFRNAFVRRSEHDRALGPDSRRRRHRAL